MTEFDHDELIGSVQYAAETIANAITPTGAAANADAAGNTVESLTEACMGITAGLMAIAAAVRDHADAVRDARFH